MQSPKTPDHFGDVLLWTAVVIALLLALWVVWMWLRKQYHAGDDGPAAQQPWSLQELRDLRENEQITEVEYQALRQQVIGMVRDRKRAQSQGSGGGIF